MGCHVRKNGDFTDYQILWLKNGNKTDWISRGRIRKQSELEQRSDTELESETDGVDFFFKIPNESDLGKQSKIADSENIVGMGKVAKG